MLGVGRVRKSGGFAGAALDDDVDAELLERRENGRNDRDAALAGKCFSWNAELHRARSVRDQRAGTTLRNQSAMTGPTSGDMVGDGARSRRKRRSSPARTRG